jgi:SAM-dependent methyltransferase
MAFSPLTAWTDLSNTLDLTLRNRLTWSPPARERAEADVSTGDPREPVWTDRYALGPARNRMTATRWARNLAVVELLEASVSGLWPRQPGWGSLRVLDIGSKNFDYVDALAGFFSWANAGGPVEVTGIEVDAHRRYTDLRTRRAWADHYASFVPGSRYLAGDLEDHQGRYDAVTWFFPFVSEFPLRRWGLPHRLFRPQALFDHAWDLLEPGGTMVIVNLNAAEEALQQGLIRARGLEATSAGPVPGSFSTRAADQRVTLVSKPTLPA